MLIYEDMSDFDINCAAAKKLGFEDMMSFNVDRSICGGPVWNVSAFITGLGIQSSRGNNFDPCNSWADAGPIILLNDISVIKLETKWMAITSGSGIESYIGEDDEPCLYGEGFDVKNENPLRAAMIVFLMMKENGK